MNFIIQVIERGDRLVSDDGKFLRIYYKVNTGMEIVYLLLNSACLRKYLCMIVYGAK